MADTSSPSLHRTNRCSATSCTRSSPRARRRRRRFDPRDEKLPSPPPDPRSELPEPTCTTPSRAINNCALTGTEEAFRHLDQLHAVLEQILELRHKNARLFRRVRELERLRVSHRLDESIRRSVQLLHSHAPEEPEEDTGFAESLLNAMLGAAQGIPPEAPGEGVSRRRSRSIGGDSRAPVVVSSVKRSSCHLQYRHPLGAKAAGKRVSLGFVFPPKVSKWTKVKAAFRWEKAGIGTIATTVGSSGSTVETTVEQTDDTCRFLRPPVEAAPEFSANSTTTPSGSSPRTAEHSGPPSPATLSSSSSVDDVYGGYKRTFAPRATTRINEEKNQAPRSRSLEGEVTIPQNILCVTQNSREGVSRKLEKIHKTPWGMVKEIIQSRRDNATQRPLPHVNVRSEDGYSLSSHGSSDVIHEIPGGEAQRPSTPVQRCTGAPQLTTSPELSPPTSPTLRALPIIEAVDSGVGNLASRRLTPTLTITLPSNEELRSASSPESAPPLHQRRQLDVNSTSSTTDDSSSASKFRPGAYSSRAGPGESSTTTSGAESTRPWRRPDSKWNKVKRAFLTSASSVPPSPSRLSSFFNETDGGGSYSASAEELDNNNEGTSPTTQADIQRNYRILHDKLSLEFHRKLTEWDKLKNVSGTTGSTRPLTSPKDKDAANALLMGEGQLTPEFRKKLQEWKRIKKGSSASPEQQPSRRRLADWQIWRTTGKSDGKTDADAPGKVHLSDDFLKKMEEWKKIKATRPEEDQTSSSRRGSGEAHRLRTASRKWQQMDESEFQPLNKLVAMIEREQRRMEKHRDKLHEPTPRTSALSRVLDSASPEKREVLVHTATGFYRFEGISQEFTKKLYEWEKSRGIAPEFSTLQLLDPSYEVLSNDPGTKISRSKSLQRSKSMSSVVENSTREATLIRQPSSLSLNDVENLENEAKLRSDSKQTIGEEEMSEELAIDDSEPEAVIVDIEDVVEETASPMAKLQPQQTPVYCVTASETTSIAVPLGTVTASHEPSPVILIQPGETHHSRIERHCRCTQFRDNDRSNGSAETYSSNAHIAVDNHRNNDTLSDDHRKRYFEPTEVKICETIIEEDTTSSLKEGESNADAETSSVKTEDDVESLKEVEIMTNVGSGSFENFDQYNQVLRINRTPHLTRAGLSSPICDTLESAPSKVKVIEATNTPDAKKVADAEAEVRTLDDSVMVNHKVIDISDAIITVSNEARPKKMLKTRRLTDTQVGYKWQQASGTIEEAPSPDPQDALTVSTYPETPSVEKIILNESTLNKIIVPTASNEQISNIAALGEPKEPKANDHGEPHRRRLNIKSESKSVFVKTKRIIFSPFSRRNSKDKQALPKEEPSSPVAPAPSSPGQKLPDIQRSKSSSECPATLIQRPPLPQSPILSRKEYRRSSPKETAPSIRMMIQRYNQKLQEDASSPASSGSGSPIWRSPTSERRVRTQMERYQEEVQRAVSGSPRNRVEELSHKRLEKSASAGIIQSPPSTARASNVQGEISKSTSADFVGLLGKRANGSGTEGAVDDYGEKRRNSLKNAEIFTNIKQSLAQEYKVLPIKTEVCNDRVDKGSRKLPGKLSPELIHKLNALSTTSRKHKRLYANSEVPGGQATASENSTPLRAQRMKKAKDDFFSHGPSCCSHDARAPELNSKMEFMRSASAGMINVDTRTFERLSTTAGEDAEALPRVDKACAEVAGAFSKIASKFRRAKLKRGKDRDGKMSTVSMLCRQSLLVDIQAGEMSKSCPTSPSPHRDEDDVYRFKQHRESK